MTLWPSFQGVHNLYPQSFSPKTGLVYVPTIEMPAQFGGDVDYKNWHPLPSSIQYTGFPTADGDVPADAGKSFLVAWDPVKQRAAWQQPTPGPHNGGTLATAGDLVFQGQADGYINAYGASDGRKALVVLRGHGRARHADHLFDRQDAVRVDPHRAAARRARRLRLRGGALRLGCAHSSAAPADLRARRQGQTTADAAAHLREAAGCARK